jgi:hypothetical protein
MLPLLTTKPILLKMQSPPSNDHGSQTKFINFIKCKHWHFYHP